MPEIAATKNFLEWKNEHKIDLDDKILSQKEIIYLQQRLLQTDKQKTTKDMLEAVKIMGQPAYAEKLRTFINTPGDAAQKVKAMWLTREDVAVFQFMINLENPTKRVNITGNLDALTYQMLMKNAGAQSNKPVANKIESYLGKDGNIDWLNYDFSSVEEARQCNKIIAQKFDFLVQTCKKAWVTAWENPFSKIYTWTWHFQFDGLLKNGDSYEIDPLFSPKDLWGEDSKLYNIIDKNEDVFLSYLNSRWNEQYQKQVVEKQQNKFIPGLDINWGVNTEKVKSFLDRTMIRAKAHNDKYPSADTAPFKDDDSTDDQEIYFKWEGIQKRVVAQTGESYNDKVTVEMWIFSAATLKNLGIENIMTDDNNVNKVVKYLNKRWLDEYVRKVESTKKAPTISKEILAKKLTDDTDLTPAEIKALAVYEAQDFAKVMASNDIWPKEKYLELYTRDEALSEWVGEKRLENLKKVAEALIKLNPAYALQILKKLHMQYDDERHPDSAMSVLKQFTQYFGNKLYEAYTKANTKEINKTQLLALAKLITDRNWDIDSDLKDYPLAKKIMNEFLPTLIDKSKIEKKRDDQCEAKFNATKAKLVQSFGSVNVGWVSMEKLSWSSLKTFEKKQYVNTLVEYVTRFGDVKKDKTLVGLSTKEQISLINERVKALVQYSMKWLVTSFTDYCDKGGKVSSELWLTGFQKEVYDMYRDMMGIGKMNLSDEHVDTVITYSKVAGTIVIAIGATIVTVASLWTASPAAVVSWAAVGVGVTGALAWSAAWYAADYVINSRQAESNSALAKDFFSTIAVDIATSWPFALIPWLAPLLERFPTLAKVFVKVWTKIWARGIEGTEMLTSAVVSWYAEKWRQEYILGRDKMDVWQLIQQIGMWLALPAILQWWPKLFNALKTKWELPKIETWLEEVIHTLDEALEKPGVSATERNTLKALKKSYDDLKNKIKELKETKIVKEKEDIKTKWWDENVNIVKKSVDINDNSTFDIKNIAPEKADVLEWFEEAWKSRNIEKFDNALAKNDETAMDTIVESMDTNLTNTETEISKILADTHDIPANKNKKITKLASKLMVEVFEIEHILHALVDHHSSHDILKGSVVTGLKWAVNWAIDNVKAFGIERWYARLWHLTDILANGVLLFSKITHLIHAIAWLSHGDLGWVLNMHLKSGPNVLFENISQMMKIAAEQMKNYQKMKDTFNDRGKKRETTKYELLNTKNVSERQSMLQDMYTNVYGPLHQARDIRHWYNEPASLHITRVWEDAIQDVIIDPSEKNIAALHDAVSNLNPQATFLSTIMSTLHNTQMWLTEMQAMDVHHDIIWANLHH